MITTATKGDWESFWYSPEENGTWKPEDFSRVWKEMDEIEPLTPKTFNQTEKESDYQI